MPLGLGEALLEGLAEPEAEPVVDGEALLLAVTSGNGRITSSELEADAGYSPVSSSMQ